MHGYGIHAHINKDIAEIGAYDEHDLWGYDADTKKVHALTVINTGTVHDHVGEWKDANTLDLNWKGLAEGKETSEHIIIRWVSSNELRAHEEDTIEGELGPISDFSMKKR